MSKPIAWLHKIHPTAYVITNRVKQLWVKCGNPEHVENYTIPLYERDPEGTVRVPVEMLRDLRAYGMISTVEGVIYSKRHYDWLREIDTILLSAAPPDAPGWVAVGLKLPERDARVLAVSHTGRMMVEDGAEIHRLWNAREPGEDCYIAYWQELPPAPDAQRRGK